MALDLHTPGLSDGLVILGAAGIVIPAFARARITPVIGFILVGVLVGPFGLGALAVGQPWLRHVTIADPARIAPIAELGVVLLLFSIGLDLSFRRVWAMRRTVVGFGASELVGGAALIAAVLLATGTGLGASLGLGIALALSSTALVLPIVGTSGPVGRRAFAMLLFEDLALVPIIFLLGVLAPSGADVGMFARTLVAGMATVVAMLVIGWFALPLLFAQAARTKSPELFLSTSLITVIAASLATAAVGLSPIVGALVAGLLIAETNYADAVEAVIVPFRGLALGVFLIGVGMGVDLTMVARLALPLVAAVAGVIVIKTLVTFVLLRLARVRTGVAAETGLLMASPSETTLIVLGSAASAGLIDAPTAAFWQVVTAIGLTVTPLLAAAGHAVARRIEWRRGEVRVDAPLPPASVVIIGFGRVGRMVADMLDVHARSWIAVEADVDIVTAARRDGRPVRFGDAARGGTLDRLGVADAAAVVLTMDDPVQQLALTRRLRTERADLTIVARARDAAHAAQLYRAGATDAVPETLESSLQLAESLLVDLGIAMGPIMVSVHEKREQLRGEICRAGSLVEAPRLKSL